MEKSHIPGAGIFLPVDYGFPALFIIFDGMLLRPGRKRSAPIILAPK